jgi:hypothetical protein
MVIVSVLLLQLPTFAGINNEFVLIEHKQGICIRQNEQPFWIWWPIGESDASVFVWYTSRLSEEMYSTDGFILSVRKRKLHLKCVRIPHRREGGALNLLALGFLWFKIAAADGASLTVLCCLQLFPVIPQLYFIMIRKIHI